MKIALTMLFGLPAVAANAADSDEQLPPPPAGNAWKLVWHDEFDGNRLDEAKWDVPDHKRRDGWWSPKAVAPDGNSNLVISTLMDGDRYGKEHRSEGHVAKVQGVMEGWHTFALGWKADEYVFFVDGKETWRSKDGGVCQVPLYIKLSDEIGDWSGDITQAKLPDRFLVDDVRVYDLNECGTLLRDAGNSPCESMSS